jgi:hypothetical protein
VAAPLIRRRRHVCRYRDAEAGAGAFDGMQIASATPAAPMTNTTTVAATATTDFARITQSRPWTRSTGLNPGRYRRCGDFRNFP